MNWMFTLIGVAVMLFGLSFVGGTIILLVRKQSRIKKWTKTMGVVVDIKASLGMQQNYSSTRNTLYKPTVRFQTADGRVIDYTPNTSNSWNNYQVGENVPIYYDPQQPPKAYFGTTFNLCFPFLIFGFVGGMFTVIGAFFVLISMNLP